MRGWRPVCVAQHRTSRCQLSPPNNLTSAVPRQAKKRRPKKAALKENFAVTELHSQHPCYNSRDHSSRQRAAIASGAAAVPVGAALTELQAQLGRLIDRYGHEHSEAIFCNWTPAAIKAMGIRRVAAPLLSAQVGAKAAP